MLRRSVGCGQALAAAVLVEGAAADHGPDTIAIGLGIAQAFEYHHAAAFAAYVAIRGRIEGVAASRRGHGLELAEVDDAFRREYQVDAAGEGQGALAGTQGLRRQVDGDQGGRAGGVEGDARAFEAEPVGYPARDGAVRGAQEGVGVDRVGLGQGLGLVFGAADAEVESRRAVHEGAIRQAGMFERLPAGFEQNALLRVQAHRFAR